jgi:cysteine desulfurase/selenocysteine lyase
VTAYLNHAGTSWPKPAAVRAAAAAALVADPRTWPERFEEAHRTIAAFLGLDDPGPLLLTPGCTSALAVAVGAMRWKAGDAALLSRFEHAALERPLAALATRGVSVETIAPTKTELVDLDRLQDRLRRGDVRMVALSAAANATGDVVELEPVVKLAQAQGAIVLVDAAQVVGWIDLDLSALGADLVAFGGHKGLQGIWGIGGLYAGPGIDWAVPRIEGAASPPGYCDGGSVDRSALEALAAATAWLEAPERSERLARARSLASRLQAELERSDDWRVLARQPAERRMPTVAAVPVGRPLSPVRARLDAAGIVYGAGLQCAPLAHHELGTQETGTLRFSFGPDSSDADLQALVATL